MRIENRVGCERQPGIFPATAVSIAAVYFYAFFASHGDLNINERT